MPTTDCLPELALDFHPAKPITLTFDAPQTSSDGGLVLLRQLDDRLGLCDLLAMAVPDARDPQKVLHPRPEQLRQRVFQIALGYEDVDDADTLRADPLFKLACDRRPTEPQHLSSQPTLSRLEHVVTARDVVTIQHALEQAWVDELPADTTCVVLDLDTTDDPTHGQQPLSFFHAYYDQHMYFPVLLFDGDGRLISARLRAGNAGQYRYARPLLARVIRALKARFPRAQVLVRADAGFGVARILEDLDRLGRELGDVEYVIGVQSNAALRRLAQDAIADAAATFAATRRPVRAFSAVSYAAGTWSRARHVVVKTEHTADGPNTRFVVTTLAEFTPRFVYERAYLPRCGGAEHGIKAFKRALHGDRLSCTTYVANAFRLQLHVVSYRLLDALRRHVAVAAPALATAQFDTLQLRLLKVAAHVHESVRRIVVALPRSFPWAPLFRAVAAQTRGPAPPS